RRALHARYLAQGGLDATHARGTVHALHGKGDRHAAGLGTARGLRGIHQYETPGTGPGSMMGLATMARSTGSSDARGPATPRRAGGANDERTAECKKANGGTVGLRAVCNGAPGRIRTSDPQVRSLVLYPAELRARRAEAEL